MPRESFGGFVPPEAQPQEDHDQQEDNFKKYKKDLARGSTMMGLGKNDPHRPESQLLAEESDRFLQTTIERQIKKGELPKGSTIETLTEDQYHNIVAGEQGIEKLKLFRFFTREENFHNRIISNGIGRVEEDFSGQEASHQKKLEQIQHETDILKESVKLNGEQQIATLIEGGFTAAAVAVQKDIAKQLSEIDKTQAAKLKELIVSFNQIKKDFEAARAFIRKIPNQRLKKAEKLISEGAKVGSNDVHPWELELTPQQQQAEVNERTAELISEWQNQSSDNKTKKSNSLFRLADLRTDSIHGLVPEGKLEHEAACRAMGKIMDDDPNVSETSFLLAQQFAETIRDRVMDAGQFEYATGLNESGRLKTMLETMHQHLTPKNSRIFVGQAIKGLNRVLDKRPGDIFIITDALKQLLPTIIEISKSQPFTGDKTDSNEKRQELADFNQEFIGESLEALNQVLITTDAKDLSGIENISMALENICRDQDIPFVRNKSFIIDIANGLNHRYATEQSDLRLSDKVLDVCFDMIIDANSRHTVFKKENIINLKNNLFSRSYGNTWDQHREVARQVRALLERKKRSPIDPLNLSADRMTSTISMDMINIDNANKMIDELLSDFNYQQGKIYQKIARRQEPKSA